MAMMLTTRCAPAPTGGESTCCFQLCKVGIESLGIEVVASQLPLAMQQKRNFITKAFLEMWLSGKVDTVELHDA